MKRYPGMMIAAVAALAATMFLAGYTTARAQEVESMTWTTHECTPHFNSTSEYNKLTIKKVSLNHEINLGETDIIQGFASLNIDGIEGTGAYKVHGQKEINGSIINGINYIAIMEGSDATLFETGDPFKEIETGEPEYVRQIEIFTCKETERVTRKMTG